MSRSGRREFEWVRFCLDVCAPRLNARIRMHGCSVEMGEEPRVVFLTHAHKRRNVSMSGNEYDLSARSL